MKLGELEIIPLIDGHTSLPGNFYGNVEKGRHADMLGADGRMNLPIGCFAVRSGASLALLDCGMGPHVFEWTPPDGGTLRLEGGALPEAMKAAGIAREDVDLVLPTHLHADHAGWLLHEGAAYFPNAEIRFGAGDWEALVVNAVDPEFRSGLEGLSERGRVRLIENDGELVRGISALATPGHTPGHTSYVLSSGDERALVLGDFISCPLQIEFPENEGLADMDRELAARVRERVLRELDGQDTLVSGPHFPDLAFGRILRGQGRRYWSAY